MKRAIRQCNNKYAVKGEKGCENKHVDEKLLYEGFINVINEIVKNKEVHIKKWKEQTISNNPLESYMAKQLIKTFKKVEKVDEFHKDLYFDLIDNVIENHKRSFYGFDNGEYAIS